MRKFIVILLCQLIIVGAIFAQSSEQGVLIIPLIDKSDTEKFKDNQAYAPKILIFNTLYNFIRILPNVNVPTRNKIKSIGKKFKGSAITELKNIALKHNSKFIIFGNIRLEGDTIDPEATIGIKVWSQDENKFVFEKSYKTALDLDLFDAVDQMIIDIIETTFKIQAKFATLNINNFKIGSDTYQLYINNKKFEVITNSSFSFSTKVLANTPYNIMVERVKDRAMVINTSFTLEENESTNISYSARGVVNIDPVLYKDPKKQYRILLNGQKITNHAPIESLDASKEHNLMVLDNKSIMQFHESFLLKDNETITIQPIANWGGIFHLRTYFLGGAIGGIGADFSLTRKMWLGVNTGFTFTTKNTGVKDESVYLIMPSIDFGYYILGDMEYDFRLAAGANIGLGVAFPNEIWVKITDTSPINFIGGIFATAEWKMLYLRLAVYFDSGGVERQIGVSPSIGFKF